MSKMPVLFVGHGSPMNAIENNEFTRSWEALGQSLPRPACIVSVSAHWYTQGTRVMDAKSPRTIYDMYGFPDALYRVVYAAAGAPDTARRAAAMLTPPAETDNSWGIDHGTWSVLTHVFPRADIPVVQLAIDERQPPAFHYELGKRLAPLRAEGVLVISSGNLVHNLHAYAWGQHGVRAYDWAVRFEERVRELLLAGNHGPLVAYEELGRDAQLSVPTPDHYLPLLYVLGLRRQEDPVSFPVHGVDGGSVSMLAVRFG